MILTGAAIASAVRNGQITIDPFDRSNINPNSYNFHLAATLFAPNGRERKRKSKVVLDQGGYVMRPGAVYLAATHEKIGSDQFVTLLLGRSSIGRLGMFLNVTADMGHLGSCSHWTLEIVVVQPTRVYPMMKIGQVSFWKTQHEAGARYNGRYQGDNVPVANRDARLVRSRS